MNRITFPLRQNMRRKTVKDLQAALRFLELDIDAEEVDAGRYGRSTAAAVRRFQRANRLRDSGQIDKKTAGALNLMLSRGNQFPYFVRGQISSPEEEPLPGLLVRAVDKDPSGENPLGKPQYTDDDGRYVITYFDREFRLYGHERGNADIVVQVYAPDGDGQLLAESEMRGSAPRDFTVDLQVDYAPPDRPEPGDDDEFKVQGLVRYPDGRPLPDVQVRAFDVRVRQEHLLGQDTTGEDGGYEISYIRLAFRLAGKTAPDLCVRAFDDQDEEVARSAILFEAGKEEVVDLTVGNVLYRGPAEYDQLRNSIEPRLRGLKLAELREDDDYQDVTYLSGESGEDPRLIAMLVAAQRLQARTEIPAEIFYGFFRNDLPLNLPALLVQDPAVLKDAVQSAADDNIIHERFVEQCDGVLAKFKELVVREAVRPRDAEAEKGPMVALLDTALPATDRQESFLRQYVAHTGPMEAFWDGLRAMPEFKDEVDGLQFTFQVGALTGSHLPLVQELQRQRSGGEIASARDLVRLDVTGWREILEDSEDRAPIGAPAGVPGEGEQKVANYARVLTRRIERSYPTAFVEARLQDDDLEEKENLLRFFQRNLNPQDDRRAFDINGARLESYLDDNPTALDNVSEGKRDVVKKQLRAMQRVYRAAPQYEAMSTLLKDGIDSAQAITRMGRTLFTLKYGRKEAFGDVIAAGRVARRAEVIQHTTHAYLQQFGAQNKTIAVESLADFFPSAVDGIPDWQTLFGSLELCECDHCRSVLSPAAYLVDTLHFLDGRYLIDPNSLAYDEFGRLDPESVVFLVRQTSLINYSAKDVLFERRADLGTIELTCENTQTRLPYVDLVNEILEDFVTPPPPFSPFTLASALAGDLDGGNVSAALRAAFSSYSLSAYVTIQVLKEGEQWRLHDRAYTYTISLIADAGSSTSTLRVTTRSRQTNGSEEELAANPQYLNPDAYDRLDERVYPMTLPFDLSSAEARTYLDHLDVRRYQIMEAFLLGDRAAQLANPDIGRERLGLTPAEARLISGETTGQADAVETGVWNLFGFPKQQLGAPATADPSAEPCSEQVALDASNAIPDPADSNGWVACVPVRNPADTAWIGGHNWLDILTGRVDVFLQQLGLIDELSTGANYKRMLSLLGAYYVNPFDSGARRLVTIPARVGQPEDTCETQQLRIAGMDEKHALRALRFLRLWHKLDWSMRDLDRALLVLGAANIDKAGSAPTGDGTTPDATPEDVSPASTGDDSAPDTSAASAASSEPSAEDDATDTAPDPIAQHNDLLTQISHIQRLREMLRVPVERLLPFWGPIDTALYTNHEASGQPPFPSLYEQLFLNRSVVNPPDPAFAEVLEALTGNQSDNVDTFTATRNLSNHQDTVTAALGISSADLTLLLSDANVAANMDPVPESEAAAPGATGGDGEPGAIQHALSLDNLSQLYRHATLARGLGLPVREYLVALTLYGADPFADTTATVLFVERINAVLAGGLTLTELDYLARHEIIETARVAPTDEEISLVLANMRAELQSIATENTFVEDVDAPGGQTVDPDGDLTAQKLALLGWQSESIELAIATLSDGVTYRAGLAALPAEASPISLLNEIGTFETPLAALPQGFDFPAEFDTVVTHNATDQELSVSRLLSPFERRSLLAAASAYQTVQSALQTIFSRQDERQREIQGEISYDSDLSELRFEGAMTDPRMTWLKSVSSDPPYQNAIDILFDQPRDAVRWHMRSFEVETFQAALAALPAIAFLAPFSAQITHSGSGETGLLSFTGVMTEVERAALLELSTDSAYRQAIDTLFAAGQASTGATDPFTAPLAAMPPVALPFGMQDRIYHNAEAGALYFVGVMSEADREVLLGLSTDSVYQVAVRALYAAPDQAPSTDSFISGGGSGSDTVALFDQPTTPADRFAYVLRRLLPYLRNLLSQRAVVQLLADNLDMETPTVRDLLQRWLGRRGQSGQSLLDAFRDPLFAESHPDLPVTPTLFREQFDAYLLLHKIALIVERFDCTTRQVSWLFTYATSAGWPNLSDLPIAAQTQPQSNLEEWRRLIELFAVRDRLARGEEALDELLRRADEALQGEQSPDPAARSDRKEGYVEALGQWTEWPGDDLETLLGQADDHSDTGQLGQTFPADYAGARLLGRLQACFALLRCLGLSAAQCSELSAAGVSQATAGMVKRAARAKYDEEQWLELARPLRDVLREQQRAALVAYLLANPSGQYAWRDTNDVYDHFLIDVEMDPCMMTSRIRQAMSSVQLFVQRCQMGLEPQVLASAEIDERWLEWRWMKNYRVWEANRRVFLYPENWIEPELRDDKSPFFDDLESALLQDDVTLDTAEAAFRAYLDSLDEVARLEVVGMYHQVERDGRGEIAVNVMHVFGRTPGTPHIYFYRRWVKKPYEHWTAWERVDLDIEGNHLIPVVWLRRLFLIWPIFNQETQPVSPSFVYDQPLSPPPRKRWNIQLARSEYKNGQWLPKRVSDSSLDLEWQDDLTPKSDFYFRAVGNDAPQLVVRCYRRDPEGRGPVSRLPDPSVIAVGLQEGSAQTIALRQVRAPQSFEAASTSGQLGAISQSSGIAFGNASNESAQGIYYGSFVLSGCNSDFSVVLPEYGTPYFLRTYGIAVVNNYPLRSIPQNMTLSGGPDNLNLPRADEEDDLAVASTVGSYRLLYLHQAGFDSLRERPWFYNDEARTYLVQPDRRWVSNAEREYGDWGITEPEAFDPDILPHPGMRFDLGLEEPFGLFEGLGMLGIELGPVINPGDPPPFEVTYPITEVLVDRLLDGRVIDPRPEQTLPAGMEVFEAPAAQGGARPGEYQFTARTVATPNSLGGGRWWEQARQAMLAALPQARAMLNEVDKQGIYAVSGRHEYLYTFRTFYHPVVCNLIEALNMNGIDGLLNRPQQLRSDAGLVFQNTYRPVMGQERLVNENYPVEDVDFSVAGPYSQYNWELFFHAPLLIANSLRQNQRFEDAQRWFHYIFDPTDSSSLASPQRYWRTKPFFQRGDQEYQRQHIVNIMRLLASGGRLTEFANELLDDVNNLRPDEWTYIRQLLANENRLNQIVDDFGTLNNEKRATMRRVFANEGPLNELLAVLDPAERDELEVALRGRIRDALEKEYGDLSEAVLAWRGDPFKPHLVARLRTVAYQRAVVMKYIDNLIAWGDQLFRRDTMESLNEATQLYILAADILGKRPEEIPPRAVPEVHTYDTIESLLGDFSTALVQIEEFVPPSVAAGGTVGTGQGGQISLPTMLYFCVTKNDNLLDYWDIIADRLFKIRHCMNIEGVVRQLDLFAPPIDPAVLVRAVAAGVDIGSVLNNVSAALPHYRFNVLAQKATELCGELKSLSAALLAALEKRDAEKLALLRAEHEAALLKLVEQVRDQQLQESEQQLTALRASREIAVGRYLHYQKLLGVQDVQVPAEGEAIPEYSPSELASVQDTAGVKMIGSEDLELGKLGDAIGWQHWASGFEVASSVANIVPTTKAEPYGVGMAFGGPHVGAGLSAFAGFFRALANERTHDANKASKMAQHILREHDWVLQSNSAAKEIMNIDQQIIAADLRKAIADHELQNHRKQIEQAQNVEEMMRDKYTDQELYNWMVGQISTVYFQSYQLAYDVAKRAERAYRHELGLRDSDFIQFGYWDSLKKGLLAGDRLHHDLKRMEVAFLDQHKREFDIVKNVSLVRLDPVALAQLKQSGVCTVTVPEALYDLDNPGHYMRRIKSVGVTVPCVTGPYTSVNCTLTLLRSSVRHASTMTGGSYSRDQQNDDPRFTDNLGNIQSIVTSSGQNDSGLFETNLRDERFLPFEGAGAISTWRIELPNEFRQFDYETISDVVLHIRYTARPAGSLLKEQAIDELRTAVNTIIKAEQERGLARSFSLRHEFGSEWHAFLHPANPAGPQSMALPLGPDRFPFMFQDKGSVINNIQLLVKVKDAHLATHDASTLRFTLAAGNTAPIAGNANPTDILTLTSRNGVLRAEKPFTDQPGNWTLNAWLNNGDPIHPDALEDVLLVCHYTIQD